MLATKFTIMHLPDLSLHSANPDIYNIGWLSPVLPFEKGPVSDIIIEKLIVLEERLLCNQTRGTYPCYFCDQLDHYTIRGERLFLGSSEIWIPSGNFEKVYVAPNLIVHYMHDHMYLPPAEFIDAIVQFDLESTWDGEGVYKHFNNIK